MTETQIKILLNKLSEHFQYEENDKIVITTKSGDNAYISDILEDIYKTIEGEGPFTYGL